MQHFVAFANADGGTLVVGIEDNGDVTGFKDSRAYPIEKFKTIHHELRKTPIRVSHEEVSVQNIKGDNDIVLIITIEVEQSTVIKLPNDTVFLRQNDKLVNLNYNQRTQLIYDKGQRFFEDEIIEFADLEDIDDDLIYQYKMKLGVPEMTTEKILKVRGLMINNQLTKAAILLFGKNPSAFLPQARLRVLKIDGDDMGVGANIGIVKDMTFDKAIPKIIDEAKSFINTQLRDFQYLDNDGIFQIMPEYPEFAWFEGIVNAVTHRNYSISGDHIKIFIYNNRMEIKSSGILPNIVTLKNIKYEHFSRNPKIARVLSEFGWVRELNEGVKRIYDEMAQLFLNEPKYSEPSQNSVLLVLENNILNRQIRAQDKIKQSLTPDVYKTLNQDQKKLVLYLYNSGQHLTNNYATQLLNRSTSYTRKILKNLHEKNILEWHGSSKTDRNQYYTLNLKIKSE